MTQSGAFRGKRYSSQDGLSLYYRDYGDTLAPGTPVLCLPGITRNSKDFEALAERLSPRRRVVCPDYRGRGRSDYDPDWRNYRPPTYVNDLRHLLAAAGLHRAAIVGTSLGGFLAMGLAVATPGAVAGVVLNDVGPDISFAAAGAIVDYVGTDRPEPDFDAAIAAVKERFAEFDAWDDEVFRTVADATYRLGDDGQYHFDWDVALAKPFAAGEQETHDLWSLFDAIGGVPVLAIRGAKSDLLSEDGVRAMAERHPGLTSVAVDGVGHAPRLVEPPAWAAIATFMSNLDTHRSGDAG